MSLHAVTSAVHVRISRFIQPWNVHRLAALGFGVTVAEIPEGSAYARAEAATGCTTAGAVERRAVATIGPDRRISRDLAESRRESGFAMLV